MGIEVYSYLRVVDDGKFAEKAVLNESKEQIKDWLIHTVTGIKPGSEPAPEESETAKE